MTSPLLLAGVLVVAAALLYAVVRASRGARGGRAFDLGVVSTRWLAELRRDEPWTPS